jgi:hypothetical protein
LNVFQSVCRKGSGPLNVFQSVCRKGSGPLNLFQSVCRKGSGPLNLFQSACRKGSGPSNLFHSVCQKGSGPSNLFHSVSPKRERRSSFLLVASAGGSATSTRSRRPDRELPFTSRGGSAASASSRHHFHDRAGDERELPVRARLFDRAHEGFQARYAEDSTAGAPVHVGGVERDARLLRPPRPRRGSVIGPRGCETRACPRPAPRPSDR